MSQIHFFWNGWEPIGRILIVGTFAYISIILLLRSTGKRTLTNQRLKSLSQVEAIILESDGTSIPFLSSSAVLRLK